MIAKTTKTTVIERKLGRERAFGQYYDGIVEIDPRQCSHEYLDTLIHEMLHHHFPEATEKEITTIAERMTAQIWDKNYRRLTK